jgi:1-acyl-sn-glycerol-3-phosphate acyltransferase
MEPVWGLGRVILYPVRPAFRFRMAGKERVPREGPVILASNHVSVLDPLFMLWLGERTHRKPRFMAMAELWDHRIMRFFLVHTHMIPVARDSSQAAGSLAAAARALQSGECVAIYPEGKVSEDFEPMPGKTGVGRLAALTGAPVFPVGVWGGHRLWPKGRARRLRPGVGISIAVGEPVRIEPHEDAFDATDRIMEGVAGAVGLARRIYPPVPRSTDDGWWVRSPETAVMQPARRDRTHDRWS